jgi:hypothetical protein
MTSLTNIYNKLSKQGKWAWWVGIIMIINSAIAALLLPKHLALSAFAVTLLVVVPLLIYHINCLVVGECKTFAWVILIIALLTQTITLLSHIAISKTGVSLQ